MKNLTKACIAMAAFAAIFVVPSMASAALELTHPTGTRLAAGKFIQATNINHSTTPTQTVMVIPGLGNVECTTATLTGELTKNDGTAVEGNITTAEFKGTPGVTPHTNHCKSPLGNVTVTPNHTISGSLPWCVKAKAENIIEVRGGKCSEVARPLTFTLHTPIGACNYEKAAVTGTYTTHPAAAIATINKQAFVRHNSSGFCPAGGELNMAFTLETDGFVPETDVFIDK